MVTLHAYFLRELLKTFLLTITALTVLFTMGGGIYNVMRYEGVTTADLFRVMPLLLPVVITLTMPIAALFSATIVYGRFAADNELTACRAAGINVHRTFLSAVLLAVFVALITLLAGNFLIPDFMLRIDRYVRSNVREIVYQQLRMKGHMRYGEVYMTAEEVESVTDAALSKQDFPTGAGLGYLWVRNPTFLQVRKSGELVRFTSADGGLCQFDSRSIPVSVTVFLQNTRDFEIGERSVFIGEQPIGPIDIPIELPIRPSMADFATLMRWREQPWTSDRLRRDFDTVLIDIRHEVFYEWLSREILEGRSVVLQDDLGSGYTLEARETTRGDRRLLLTSPRVTVQEKGASRPTVYEAARGEIIARAPTGGASVAEIRLLQTPEQDVLVFNPRAHDSRSPREKSTLSLDGIQLPEAALARVKGMDAAALLRTDVEIPGSTLIQDVRQRLRKEAAQMQRRVDSVFHFRFSFAASVLVTALMGAALGVVFRGGRALSAFGLACIPFSVVVLLILVGRQQAERAGTEWLGAGIIWGGLVMVGLVDLLILRWGVRR